MAKFKKETQEKEEKQVKKVEEENKENPAPLVNFLFPDVIINGKHGKVIKAKTLEEAKKKLEEAIALHKLGA
jgi:hypothetical protein